MILSPNRLKQVMKQITNDQYIAYALHIEHDPKLIVYTRANQVICAYGGTAVLMITGGEHFANVEFFEELTQC